MFDNYFRINIEGEGTITTQNAAFRKMLKQIENGKSMTNIRVTIVSSTGQESKAVFNTSSIMGRDGNFEGFIAIASKGIIPLVKSGVNTAQTIVLKIIS